MKKFLLVASVLLASGTVMAESQKEGLMTQITSVNDGLMVALDTGLPSECDGLASNPWILIKQEDTAMMASALAMWVSGKKQVTIYANAVGSSCVVSQFKPE